MRPAAFAPSRILRNFVLILGGEFVGQIIAFIVGVYLARTLGVEGFGIFVFASSLVLYLVIFVDGGTETWGMREVGARPDRLRSAFASILTLRLWLGAASALVLVVIAWFAGPERQWALSAGVVAVIAFALQTNWAHRAMESAVPVLALVLQRLLLLALVVSLVHSAQGVPMAILLQGITELAAAVLLIVLLLPRLRGAPLRLPLGSAAALLRASWPFCASRALRGLPIAAMIASLSLFVGDTQTGYFGAAFRIAMLLLVASSAFGLATFPALSRAGSVGGEAELKAISAMTRLLAIVVMPVAVGGVVLAHPLVLFLFTPAYEPAVPLLQVLFVAMLLAALSDGLRRVLHVRHLQRQDLTYVACATALSLFSAAILVPAGGALGASAALVIGEAALVALALRAVYPGGGIWPALYKAFAAAAAVSGLIAVCAVSGRVLLPFTAAASLVAFVYLAALWRLRDTIVSDLATLDIARQPARD